MKRSASIQRFSSLYAFTRLPLWRWFRIVRTQVLTLFICRSFFFCCCCCFSETFDDCWWRWTVGGWFNRCTMYDVLYIWLWIFGIWFGSITSSRHWNYAIFFLCSVSAYFDLVTQTHAHAANSDEMRIDSLSAAKLDEEVLYAFSTVHAAARPMFTQSKCDFQNANVDDYVNANEMSMRNQRKKNWIVIIRIVAQLGISPSCKSSRFLVILRSHWADAYWRMLTALWREFHSFFFRLPMFSVLFDDTPRYDYDFIYWMNMICCWWP